MGGGNEGHPIVFLDIDGVLNVSRRIATLRTARVRRDGSTYNRSPEWHTIWQFQPAAIAALAEIIAATGARLVLSSTWRRREDARERLLTHGVVGPWHEDWRTDAERDGRGRQIERWLRRHGKPDYVVIDDRAAALADHAERLVETAFRVGLTAEDAKQAIDLLVSGRAGSTRGGGGGGLVGPSGASKRRGTLHAALPPQL